MPVRCPTCDAVALADDAKFCIGCGGSLADARPEPEPRSGRDLRSGPTQIPPGTEEVPVERPQFEPREAPRDVPREAGVAKAPRERAPASRDLPPLRDLEPTVPVPVVIGGVVVLLAVLLLLLVLS